MLALIAPGETLTRVISTFYLATSYLPTASISSAYVAGLYTVDPEAPGSLPDPRDPDPYDWLWWGTLKCRMLYSDPQAQPGEAITTEIAEPYEGTLDLHGQRRADTPGGLELHIVFAPMIPFTGQEVTFRVTSSALVLLVP